MKTEKVRVELTHQGQVARVMLAAPKANILDCAMMAELLACFSALHAQSALKLVLLTGEGPHFSFGASIEEHLPERIAGTLQQLNCLLWEIVKSPAPTIAVVRGQCLGGAFELALACDFIVAADTATFGLPEIKLGVFPPAGAALLPLRLGAGRASEMVLTGGTWSAAAAFAAGLVTRVFMASDLETKLDEFMKADFLPRSRTALQYATQAMRRPITAALEHELPALEHLYLEELMQHADPVEGIRAFLEKRQPRWERMNATSRADGAKPTNSDTLKTVP
jgi:cyclohexa-1,5-dienecarbonyl-CoA hydratase